MIGPIGSSAVAAAGLLGLRHGFDWDHVAALTDLTGSQHSARRSMRLATLYAIGHACMVLVLGAAAILFAERLPPSVDGIMERIVGASLIVLGLWLVWTAVRTGAAPPMRSRWMLLIDIGRRLSRRQAADGVPLVIEHSHPHDHRHSLHGHVHATQESGPMGGAEVDQPAAAETAEVGTVGIAALHTHRHRHVAVAPMDPFVQYGGWSSFGVGVLHGIGAETPTQLLVVAAAAGAEGRGTSIGVLLAFVVGLLASNTVVAASSTFGFRGVLRHRVLAATLAGATAVFSLVVGTAMVVGHGPALPPIFGG